jgi:hypothetical protein
MRNRIKIELLSTRLFVIGLAILLTNDFILKPLFHNFLTGKISDFVGLFIFPYFISIFFIRQSKFIYFFTGFLFVIWKSPLSNSFIFWWNDNIFFQINRIIDFSDLFALIVLPFSYFYLTNASHFKTKIRYAFSFLIGSIAIFSFCATSQPREEFKLQVNTNKQFTLPISKLDLFKQLSDRYGYSDTIDKNLIDTMFYCYFDIPEKWTGLTAVMKIKKMDENLTNLELDSVIAFDVTGKLFAGIDKKNVDFIKSLSANDFENYFEQNYINVILKKNTNDRNKLFFDNKELIDKYIKK